jgi:hypothetical protein
MGRALRRSDDDRFDLDRGHDFQLMFRECEVELLEC